MWFCIAGPLYVVAGFPRLSWFPKCHRYGFVKPFYTLYVLPTVRPVLRAEGEISENWIIVHL